MKKGFTLIELLAVIVILAIIALIATPIVLNIIDDTKESAGLRSAEMYLRGVEQSIMRENMEASSYFNPTLCEINTNGNLLCDGKEVIVEVDGEKPIGGNIGFEEGKINEVNLSFEPNKTIIKNEEGKLAYGIPAEKICKLKPGETKLAIGAAYTCNPGDGERTFYILEDGDNTTLQKGTTGTAGPGEVSLIMDSNFDEMIAYWWYEKPDSYPAQGYLEEETKDWTNEQILSIDFPTYNQIYNVNGSEDLTSSPWLYDNLVTEETDQAAYWTSTVYDVDYTWGVSGYSCGLYKEGSSVGDGPGVRPVITISKSNLS